MIRLLLIAATGCCCAWAADTTPQQDRARLEQVLSSKEFWVKPPSTSWNPHEVALLSQLAACSHEPAVRLRATKLIIDLAGNGYSTPQQAPIVIAAFRYIEERADQPAVARLLASPRLTHYTVSTKEDGSVWVILESMATGSNRGGVNLEWDKDRAQIASLTAWGGFAAE
ncbi:MAG: hypothetical protein FJ221_15925 [Lentisphaerae bacterium]|nr:hypothetical protein [Lentisphaerota bacterium]